MMSEYNMTCMIFLNGYFWNKGFKHNCYFMFEDALFMVSTSFMMYEMNLYWIGYILPYNHELLCTRVDIALVITSGKTHFSMSALCKDTHKIDQERYAYVLKANFLEATLLVAYFTKKGAVKIKEQRSFEVFYYNYEDQEERTRFEGQDDQEDYTYIEDQGESQICYK